MRNLKNIITATAIFSVFFTVNTLAQTSPTPSAPSTESKGKHHEKGKMGATLTDEQKAQMKENRAQGKQDQEAFRATFTAEQKTITDNKNLTPEQRKEALSKTLTSSQKEMMKNNMMARKESAQNFKEGLTDEQKTQMKKMRENKKQRPSGGPAKKD